MATTLVSTGITFPDNTTQTTAAGASGLGGMQVFTSSGTFVVPAGVTKIKANLVGGGSQGGNNGWSGPYLVGGNGGTGGGWRYGVCTVTPGASLTVTVGGSGGSSTVCSITAAGGGGGVGSGGAGGATGSGGASGTTGNSNASGGDSAGIYGYTGGGYGIGGRGSNPVYSAGGSAGTAGICVIEW